MKARRSCLALPLLTAAAAGYPAELPPAGLTSALPTPSAGAASVPLALVLTLKFILGLVVVMVTVYLVRHVLFTLNRLFGKQRHPYLDVDTADWKSVTVLVPAHNEELVIAHALDALLDVDYPPGLMTIVPIDDRSTDGTRAIIRDYAQRYPDRIRPFYRDRGKPGKAAVLKDTTALIDTELLIVFDADYVPGRGLIKQLSAPFFDPEVGAVMGRVVPHNTGSNLLTRLLDMERAGGYQVDQQARMNLGLVPQYGGSVGGTRLSALRAVGGWRDDALAEDTDLTYRLLLHGYKTVYENRSECYEEVPELWQERSRQLMRWAKGHNQSAFRYAWPVMTSPRLRWQEKLDGLLLLGVYTVAPWLIVGWLCALALYYLGEPILPTTLLVMMYMVAFSALGNFATFFEIAAAMHLDGARRRLRLLPLNFLGFLLSLINTTRATFLLIVGDAVLGRELHWEKTRRYRGSK